MNERFAYLVERLYRANCRMDRCRTDRDYQCARWWLHGWNAAIKQQYNRPKDKHRIPREIFPTEKQMD